MKDLIVPFFTGLLVGFTIIRLLSIRNVDAYTEFTYRGFTLRCKGRSETSDKYYYEIYFKSTGKIVHYFFSKNRRSAVETAKRWINKHSQ